MKPLTRLQRLVMMPAAGIPSILLCSQTVGITYEWTNFHNHVAFLLIWILVTPGVILLALLSQRAATTLALIPCAFGVLISYRFLILTIP